MEPRDILILIVDDDQERNGILTRILAADYRIHQAFSGTEALKMLEEESYHLVLLDVMLPDINGFDVLRSIKQNPQLNHLFVVLLSSLLTSTDHQSEGFESGADGYLVFPIANRELQARMRAFTRHKKTMDLLRDSEANMRAILENSPDAILVLDEEDKIEFANQSCRNFFKLEPGELIHKKFGRPVVGKEKTVIDIPLENEIITTELRSLESIIGGRKKQIVSLHDISFHRQVEENMEHKVEELLQKASQNDKMLSLIAHDLKSPFSLLLNMSELLQDSEGALSDSEKKNLLGAIHQSSQKIFNLLLNLLDWARTSLSRVPVEKRNIDLGRPVNTVIELYKETAGYKNIRILNEIRKTDAVFTDENILLALLRNLVSNAIKFTPAGGQVEIRFYHSNGNQVVEIADNGIGISEKNLQMIFSRDNLGEKIHPESGTGLGLLLCKELIEAAGGSINIQSVYGTGTTVRLKFPEIPEGVN